MIFWFFIFLLCLLAIIPVIIAWKRTGHARSDEISLDRQLYEARLEEIEADYEIGRIDKESRATAVAEEGRRFLKLTELHNARANQISAGGSRATIILTSLIVPIVSLGMYFSTGYPEYGVQGKDASVSEGEPSLEELLKVAEQRLESNPDDIRGWRVVAPVYLRMGRIDDAEKALRNIARLDNEPTQVMETLGEILLSKGNPEANREATAIMQKLIVEDPTNMRAQFFAATAAKQRGDTVDARNIWQGMLDQAQGDEPWLQEVEQELADLAGAIETGAPLGLSPEQLEQVDGMVEGLAARLEEEPGKKDDWIRLVRSYLVLGRVEEAKASVEKAAEHFSDDQTFMNSLRKMLPNEDGG